MTMKCFSYGGLGEEISDLHSLRADKRIRLEAILPSSQSQRTGLDYFVTQLCPTLCNPMGCSLPGSSIQWDFPGKNTGMGCCFLLQGNLPNPGIESGCSASQADSLLSEPPEKSGLP